MVKCKSYGAELPHKKRICSHCGIDNSVEIREMIIDGTLVVEEGTTLTLASSGKGPDFENIFRSYTL